jgi:hypothetical protein
MPQQGHRQSFERAAASVGRAIVDDDDRVALLQRTPGNVPYRSSFVERRDDDRRTHQYIAPLTDNTCPEI